jgi:hypothetical protein
MLYRPSFRKTAFALTTAAGLAGASVLASFPANAQQAVSYSTTPDCTTIHDGGKRAICESFKRIDEAKKRGAAADTQLHAEGDLKNCLLRLGDFKKAQPTEYAKLGTVTRENACELAGKLPRTSASLN